MEKQFQIIAAPMAGITDQPFRQILRRINPNIGIMTEMISCHSITRIRQGTSAQAATIHGRNADQYFGDQIDAQIFGAEPNLMAEAAKILEGLGAVSININSGCPVPKVATRAGAGAFLMRDHKLAGQIMECVRRAVKIPVTLKTRLGWDESNVNVRDMVRLAEQTGMSQVIVHARTRAQGYSGDASKRWREIPMSDKLDVIFNGDIKSQADIAMVRDMGAHGAMIGRAAMGNPWIFPDAAPRNNTIILEHLELMLSYYGARAAVPMFRKHAAWYATRRQGASDFRKLVNTIIDEHALRKVLKEFFGI